MRPTTFKFNINGWPMLVPDEPVQISYEDVDASDAGRDESGVMHRKLSRCKVAKWSFSYSHLTEEELQYMEKLFPDSATFIFGHPDRKDSTKQSVSICYRSKYALSWRNMTTGLWSGYGFNIIEC